MKRENIVQRLRAKSRVTEVSGEEVRYCEPVDGLFSNTHIECKDCFHHHREICQIFAVYKGLQDIVDLVTSQFKEEDKPKRDTRLVARLRKSKGSL